MGSVSTSYSSLISPTISSTMSSTETRPAVPPYSSITTAKAHAARPGTPSAARRSSWSPAPGRPGAPAGAAGSRRAALVLDAGRARVTTPTMSSRFSPKTGMRLYLVSRITRRRSRHGRGRGDGHDVGPRRHHVAHQRLREAGHRVHEPALVGVVHGRGRHLAAAAADLVLRRGARARRARLRSAATSGASARRVGVEDGQEQEQRALRVAAHERVGHGEAEEQQVDDHDRGRRPAAPSRVRAHRAAAR